MKPDYADIRALTDREPDWFDENGAPRYAPFEPDMLGVYDKFALLVEIACQSCGKKFLVAQGWPSWGTQINYESLVVEGKKYSLEELADGYHYGDPPRHDDCAAGDTMNCVDLRIVEAWERSDWKRGVGYVWERRPDIETIDIYPDWANEWVEQ